MSLILTDPQTEVDRIIAFLQKTCQTAGKSRVVIAVSGGVDSGLALTLLIKTIGAENVFPLLLPYADQDMTDAQSLVDFNLIPRKNFQEINIERLVNRMAEAVGLTAESDVMRMGNIKARIRMILIFDLAKKLNALVCGTENKTENRLGYFTRFGDSASDIEPIAHLYKTQVRQLASFLKLPKQILLKKPSAGLWQGQTDEDEFGFTYEQADQILVAEEGGESMPVMDDEIKNKIQIRVLNNQFKAEVPYKL